MLCIRDRGPRRNRRVDTAARILGRTDPALRRAAGLSRRGAGDVRGLRLETPRELLVVCIFHILGLVLEIFKVAAGSWEYPESGIATVAGVPLYAGFMYAAVGSYICQAFRRFDLGLGNTASRSSAPWPCWLT